MNKNIKRFTMSEANQNFSRVAKEVEENGPVIIEKQGKDRFVVIPSDEYKVLCGEVFWIEGDDTSITKLETEGRVVYMHVLVPLEEEDSYMYTYCKFPRGSMMIEHAGDDLNINFSEEIAAAVGRKDLISIYRNIEIDISDKRLAQYKDDPEIREDIILVRKLLEEYETVKRQNPSAIHRNRRKDG